MGTRNWIVSAIFVIGLDISSEVRADECTCLDGFNELVQKVEDNYIGLALLKGRGEADAFDRRREDFQKQAAIIPANRCTAFLQDFLDFFEDGHLFTFESPAYNEGQLREFRELVQARGHSPDMLLSTLADQEGEQDAIVGRWYDGESEIAVIREGKQFKAYLLDTVAEDHIPGELKGVFEAGPDGWGGTYYSYGFAPRYIEGSVYKRGELLVWTGGNYWERRHPDKPHEPGAPVAQATIEVLDDDTALFTIPSFLVDNQKFIDVILENIDLFKASRDLIIDVRGNIGGNALYFAFLDALAERSLPGGQGLVLASEDTQRYFERAAQRSQEIYGPVVERIAENPGEIVDGPAYPPRDFEDFASAIERVAILTDQGTMSAAESFILHAKQASDKITTFGEPTAGVIDYTSTNSVQLQCPDRNVYFGYPTSTLHKDIPENGHNETGLLPDVLIDSDVEDPIAFIQQFFQENTQSN